MHIQLHINSLLLRLW